MKTAFRKDMDKEIASKLLLKNSTLWQIVRHLWGRVLRVVLRVYKSHTSLVWEGLAGVGWGLFVIKYMGII
jgi:hypothetical protein